LQPGWTLENPAQQASPARYMQPKPSCYLKVQTEEILAKPTPIQLFFNRQQMGDMKD